MIRILSILTLVFLLVLPQRARASYDPRLVANNQFGIHVADPNNIAQTATLLNSNGGDWGYVTLVIPETDRNSDKWQMVFDQMRRLHLIPIVRLATKVEKAAWSVPTQESLSDWTSFLTSLNWPVENRYVVVFNEPNHAKEWGDTIDPAGYARVLTAFAKALHEANEDFFVLPAGMDTSARSDAASLDALAFWRGMYEAEPEVFSLIDGWTSHAYPNPGFSGSPYATGRGTIWGFSWELSVLSGMGANPQLPVFITETGWVHELGKLPNPSLLSPAQIGTNLTIAAQTAWRDPRVVAVTPFVFSYQDIPFDHFSWKRLGGDGFYEHYSSYQQIPKPKGTPRQRHAFTFEEPLIPEALVAGSTYTFEATLLNSGQSILSSESFQGKLQADGLSFQAIFDPLPTLEPGQQGTVRLHLQTPATTGTGTISLELLHGEEQIPIAQQTIEVVPPPSIELAVQLGWRRTSEAPDVTILVYDDATLLHKFTGLEIKGGKVKAAGLTNIIPTRSYRVVVLVPYYLPRQTVAALGAQETTITMRRLYPFDFNGDGALTLKDIPALLTTQPKEAMGRLFTP
jgi:hypothetical protein